jgi:putative flippase GtrA
VQVARFGVSGIGATLAHFVVATALVEFGVLSPTLANGAAYTCATVLAYFVNTVWSFGRTPHGRSFGRYVLVSLFGVTLTMAVASIAQALGAHYLLGILAVVLTVPLVTFVLHVRWTYR